MPPQHAAQARAGAAGVEPSHGVCQRDFRFSATFGGRYFGARNSARNWGIVDAYANRIQGSVLASVSPRSQKKLDLAWRRWKDFIFEMNSPPLRNEDWKASTDTREQELFLMAAFVIYCLD